MAGTIATGCWGWSASEALRCATTKASSGSFFRVSVGVWGLALGVQGLGFGVWGLGFGAGGLGFRV